MQSAQLEMRDQLARAVAAIEGFADRTIAPTRVRLESVLATLAAIDVLIGEIPAAGMIAGRRASRMLPVDICSLVTDEATALRACATAAGVTLTFNHRRRKHDAAAGFVCDAVQVRQLVKNLVLNAIKYAGRGGRVEIACGRDVDAFMLEVSDSGPGVAADERQSIFETGVRGAAASVAPGTGFGLSLVRRVLHAHEGAVRVTDSALGGACFRVDLPGRTGVADACHARRGRRTSAYPIPPAERDSAAYCAGSR